MRRHRFALVLDRSASPGQLERINGGADRVDVRIRGGVPVLECWWEAPTQAAAVAEAVREVDGAGLRPLRVVSGDWVTLAEIADRIGRSREIVRRWAAGRHGPGGFPPPVNVGRYASYFSWAEVAPWLRDRMGYPVPDDERVLAAANLTLQLRNLTALLPEAADLLALLAP